MAEMLPLYMDNAVAEEKSATEECLTNQPYTYMRIDKDSI